MLTVAEADQLVDLHLGNRPRAEHSRLVARLMRNLADIRNGDPVLWELVGLCHDLDFEVTANNPSQHGLVAGQWLAGKLPPHALLAIAAHDHRTGVVCDELLADMLKLADVLAVIDDRLEAGWRALLDDDNAEEKLRARLAERPYLVDILMRVAQDNAISLRRLTALWG